MTPTQVERIRESWSAVEPLGAVAATLFYDRLFELDPSLRRLFRRTDMDRQRIVLMHALTVVVRTLDGLDELVPAIEALGRRHAGHGVREAHYDTVGVALLWMLGQTLGEGFTPDVREAWTEAYTTLASVMIGAAEGEATAA